MTPTHPESPADRVILECADRRGAVVQIIDQAKTTLALSLFRCNDKAVLAALTRATARGVRVEVLLTMRAKGGTKKRQKLWDAIERTGATIHAYRDAVVKYHAKYLVADDGPALVASLNFTRKCFKKTVDAIVITYDPAIVTGLQALMAADRDGRPLPDGLPSRLIVGPERARRQFTEMITGARTRVQLVDAKASDPALMVLLQARRDSGLPVHVHDARSLDGLKSHGKIMLVDGSTAVVGGLALNALGLDFRREVALIVTAPAAIAEVARFFDRIAPPIAAPIRAVADGGTTC